MGPNLGGVEIDCRSSVGVGIKISVGVGFGTRVLPNSKLFLGLLMVVIDPRESSSGFSSLESSTMVLYQGGFLDFFVVTPHSI